MTDFFKHDPYSKLYQDFMHELAEKHLEATEGLSMPFLPNIQQTSDVAVIGLETRGWGSKYNFQQMLTENKPIEEIAQSSLGIYQGVLNREIKGKFWWLMREVKKVVDQEPMWLNFYAFDYNKTSIRKSKNKELIALIDKYSAEKLILEIELTKPKALIFCGKFHGNLTQVKNALLQGKQPEIIKPGDYFIQQWGDYRVCRIPHAAAPAVKDKGTIIKEQLDKVREYLG
ncbi:hypothetical protein [Thorsellia anophelis]|uniref:Uracil DNA glycosylase superfamily protein n=1 Tax=Thorsellia anophelis DSM 18579 TaxID=1123402 RepID=A0A1I0FWJ8_9GAMM|nr:hypothetical protein [Thorsellia anophelis]SET62051.1 hypothetical protein SAMN02583745_02901 [Thorsellia anophelis DSM 18579]